MAPGTIPESCPQALAIVATGGESTIRANTRHTWADPPRTWARIRSVRVGGAGARVDPRRARHGRVTSVKNWWESRLSSDKMA
eukprot:1190332-Prorocentrum_minimum.AAC.1